MIRIAGWCDNIQPVSSAALDDEDEAALTIRDAANAIFGIPSKLSGSAPVPLAAVRKDLRENIVLSPHELGADQ